jgi:hypothetical protein
MSKIDTNQLRALLSDENLPGTFYMLIWADVEENSEAYRALSDALFDHAAADDPDEAPARDLSDPSVRQRVVDCVLKYPEVRAATEQALRETFSQQAAKPWWKFW